MDSAPSLDESNSWTRNPAAEWGKCNLLCFDGGGVRGYWSLLALEKLMEYVAAKERKLDENDEIHSSFWPEAWPDNASQIPLDKVEEQKLVDDAEGPAAKLRAMSAARKFLPCHYFDLICGTSTGALIAIMLGRFRMSVLDCIEEYQKLGEGVFGHPRLACTLRFGVGNRSRYKAESLEDVFKDVAARRDEYCQDPVPAIRFPSERGVCQTLVATLRTAPNRRSEHPYLIRSYDHEIRDSPTHSRLTSRANTMLGGRTNTGRTDTGMTDSSGTRVPRKRRMNYEVAQNFEVWQVARAATAAPFFFDPLKIPLVGSEGYLVLRDGGFSSMNNPTKEAIKEIEELYGSDSVGSVVSVGTARKDYGEVKPHFFLTIPKYAKETTNVATNPEKVHSDLESDMREGNYWRLNDPEKLGVELDEWLPRRSTRGTTSGSKTIKNITDAFREWLAVPANVEYLQACAAQLVECRHRRMSLAEWECFATGARFRCRTPRCDEIFRDRRSFASHLLKHWPRRDFTREQLNEYRKAWRYKPASK